MPSLRIASPSAAAAFILVDMLAEQHATASPQPGQGWEVVVPLAGRGNGVVPFCLAATREWLDTCGLRSTSIQLDGHTHLLSGSRSSRSVHGS